MSANPAPSRADLKAARERAIFAGFAQAGRPDIDLATIESCEPPEPDIACATRDGERLAFELAELCPPEIAKTVGDDIKRGGGVSYVPTADPTRAILLTKLGKRYPPNVGPVDLLLCADGYLVTPDKVALNVIRATLDGAEDGLGPFRLVWFRGEACVCRVACAGLHHDRLGRTPIRRNDP
jgi:hypothetical protein